MTPAPPNAEESFERLFQQAPFGYLTLGLDDRITRANGTFLELGGYRPDEVIGRRFSELLTRGTRVFYETRHLPVLHLEGRIDEVALLLRASDGSTLPVVANAVVVFDDAGAPAAVRTAVVDSSARSQSEKDLLAERRAAESAVRRVETLQRASGAFASSTSETDLAEALCEIVGDALDAAATVIAVSDGSTLRVIGGTNPLEGLVSPSPHSPSSEALRSGHPVVIHSPDEAEAEYPEVAAGLRAAHLEGFVAFPLVLNGDGLGVLVSFFGRRREIDEQTADLVVALCRQATQILIRIRLQDELERLALHDPLTGLPNRALVRQTITRSLASATRSRRPVAIMFVDLDGFKPINDAFGHNAGDDVLREVAGRLRVVVRQGDLLGRFGGDEFVVVCEDTDRDEAAAVAERARSAIAQPLTGLPAEHRVSASIGVAVRASRGAPVSTDVILGIADAAMYDAKNSGRDRVSIRDC